MIGSPAFHEKSILLEEDDLNDLIKPKSINNYQPFENPERFSSENSSIF